MTQATPGLAFSLQDAEAHLRHGDPVLAGLMARFGPYSPRRRPDPYSALVTAILYQQLAGAAAAAILKRFLALFGDDGLVPDPARLLATSDTALRGAGISRQKAVYLRDLARHVLEGRLALADLDPLPDEEVISRLTVVKGIGEWTAHMFLMFHLGRPDVLPVGDFDVRNGMRVAYGLPEVPSPGLAREIGARWAPFRSVGSWYMWRVVEVELPD
jgi:DNA-3-methyladenine glycosylase II